MRCRRNHYYAEWNGKERRVATSTGLERLRITAEQFDLFENAMVWVQYLGINTASSLLNHCNYFSQYRGSLAEETEKQDRRFAYLATCRCGASAVLSSNAKRLVTDENTRE